MRALDDFKQIESSMEEVRINNIQLESQLASMISSMDHAEQTVNKKNITKPKGVKA